MALAIGLTTTTFAFAANLQKVLGTPQLYGWTWSVLVGDDFGLVPTDAVKQILSLPDVFEASGITVGTVKVGDRLVPGIGVAQLKGHVYPTLDSGREPLSNDEVAVGRTTLQQLGAHVGDTVPLTIGDTSRSFHIVGLATFPSLGFVRFGQTSLGNGIAGVAGLFKVTDPTTADGTYAALLLRMRPESVPAFGKLMAQAGCAGTCFETDGRPGRISSYANVRPLALGLASVLALALAATLVHVLATSVRRRRHDLAVLRSLGMLRRQQTWTFAWQAAVLVAASLAVGIPLGAAAGRWTWTGFAHGLGLALHERPVISRVVSLDHPTEIKEGMVFAIETYCPATDGYSGARIEEEVVVTDKGCRVITLFPAEELPIANRY